MEEKKPVKPVQASIVPIVEEEHGVGEPTTDLTQEGTHIVGYTHDVDKKNPSAVVELKKGQAVDIEKLAESIEDKKDEIAEDAKIAEIE